jgi:hypothetical protein
MDALMPLFADTSHTLLTVTAAGLVAWFAWKHPRLILAGLGMAFTALAAVVGVAIAMAAGSNLNERD